MRMNTRLVLGLAAALALGGSASAEQNQFGSASLLPLPQVNQPPVHVARQTGRSQFNSYNAGQEEVPAIADPSGPTPAEHGSEYSAAMEDNGWGDSCNPCMPTCCNGPTFWGGLYGLYMTRDQENDLCLSVDEFASGGTGDQVLKTRDGSMDWQGGFELRGGYSWCCGCYGLEGVYWGVFDAHEEATVFAADYAGDLVTSRRFEDLNFGIDNVADAYFDVAAMHRLQRNYDFQNIELNLLRLPFCGYNGGCCATGCYPPGFSAGGGIGVRYFRFDEDMIYSADLNTTWGDDPLDEVHYLVDVENQLVGPQIGFQTNWQCNRFSMFSDMKFGIFANHVSSNQSVRNGAGTYATINNGPYTGDDYNLSSSKDDVAFMGELRLGVGYQITQRWRVTAAYRAMAITGVALSTNQVADFFYDSAEASQIDSNGSLILHGAQFGVEFCF